MGQPIAGLGRKVQRALARTGIAFLPLTTLPRAAESALAPRTRPMLPACSRCARLLELAAPSASRPAGSQTIKIAAHTLQSATKTHCSVCTAEVFLLLPRGLRLLRVKDFDRSSRPPPCPSAPRLNG